MEGGMSPPQIVNSIDNGGMIVRHREYLQDINSTTVFTNQSFDLNPGLVATFPWLSQLAVGFEQYKFRGLVFEFKSLSSDSIVTSSNGALGAVIMATQYNALNANFPDKKTMENYEFANSDKPSRSFFHPVECKASLTTVTNLYVRSSAVPSNADQRLYDLGNFQIATVGMQSATGVLGELWCTYEIELYKPKLVAALGLNLLTDHYQLGAIQSALPLGTAAATKLVSGSNIGTSLSGASNNLISFPATVQDGSFMLIYQITCGSTATTAPAISVNASVSSLSLFNGDTTNSANTFATDSCHNCYIMYTFKIIAAGAQISLGTAGAFGGTPTGDLFIVQLNGNIIS
jgi:hypothetical protein